MSEEPLFEINNTLSRELCSEAVKKIFYVTKYNKRMLELAFAIILAYVFVVLLPVNFYYLDIINVFMCFTILIDSIFFFYCYFRGYSFPKSLYKQHITKLCTPQESVYIFSQTQFEYRTEQSTYTVLYAHIKQMIDSDKFIVLIGMNTECVINKKSMPENYGELINLLRNSSHCKYSK